MPHVPPHMANHSDSASVFGEDDPDKSQIQLVRLFMEEVHLYHSEQNTVVKTIEEELLALRIIVNELDPEQLPKVNRHGLDLF